MKLLGFLILLTATIPLAAQHWGVNGMNLTRGPNEFDLQRSVPIHGAHEILHLTEILQDARHANYTGLLMGPSVLIKTLDRSDWEIPFEVVIGFDGKRIDVKPSRFAGSPLINVPRQLDQCQFPVATCLQSSQDIGLSVK